MRRAINHGPCAVCGTNEPGLYWEPMHHVADFGVPGVPPMEMGDLSEPIRCDECEYQSRQEETDAR